MGRRLNYEGSISKVKDRKLYQGQIWLLWANGSRYRKKVYASTRREVQKKLRTLRSEQEQGIFPLMENETVRDYLLRWYENPNLRPKTLHSRKVNIERVSPYIGGVGIRELKPAQIQGVYDSLEKKLSKSSVLQAHAVLRKALRDALKEGLIVSNPMDRVVNTPKTDRREMSSLNQNEVAILLNAKDEWSPLWTLLIGTGLRIGEALGLQWESIDFDAEILTIRRTLQRIPGEGLRYQMPKTNKSRRTLYMPELVSVALREHRAKQSTHRLMLGPDWKDNGLVFPNEWGGPLEPTRINRALKRTLKSVGINRHIRVHDLRHTAASLALRKGIPGKVVQEMLGHATYATTMDIYSHVDPGMHKEAALEMNKALGG